MKKLLSDFWAITKVKPVFIKTSSYLHKECVAEYSEAYTLMAKMFETKVLSDRMIDDLFAKVYTVLLNIFDIEATVSFSYYIYTKELCSYYMEQCLSIEMYEQAENFKRFLLNLQQTEMN